MGVKAFDVWTIGHFVCGIIITATLIPSDPTLSLIVSNIFHLLLELAEQDINPKNGEILESGVNHMTDILAFFVGSVIGFYFTDYMLDHPTLRYILLFIGLLIGVQEFGRELFPESWPIWSAYS